MPLKYRGCFAAHRGQARSYNSCAFPVGVTLVAMGRKAAPNQRYAIKPNAPHDQAPYSLNVSATAQRHLRTLAREKHGPDFYAQDVARVSRDQPQPAMQAA